MLSRIFYVLFVKNDPAQAAVTKHLSVGFGAIKLCSVCNFRVRSYFLRIELTVTANL